MACELLTGGITKACLSNVGGLKKAYITDFSNVEDGFTEATGTVSAIAIASGEQYYDFEFNVNSSSFVSQDVISRENGTKFNQATITLVIPHREVAKRNTILLLAQKDLSIIVTDQNGKHWLFGRTNGCQLTDNNGGSGVAKGDLNGYTLTFIHEEPVMEYAVSQVALDSVIA